MSVTDILNELENNNFVVVWCNSDLSLFPVKTFYYDYKKRLIESDIIHGGNYSTYTKENLKNYFKNMLLFNADIKIRGRF